MGLTLPAPTVTDSVRNHPAQWPLRLPILHRPNQPTTQTRRPPSRRSSRTHHLPSNPNQNRQCLTSTHPLEPLPIASRHQRLSPLLLPQRHLRLPHPSPRSTRTNPATILHRNNTTGNSDDLQGPPHSSAAPSHDLADPNPRPTQDTPKFRNLHNHHHPRPNPPPNYSRLSTINSRLQPHQPRQRNNTHHDRSTQHNPTFNPPIHTHRILHQPDLVRHHSRSIHHHTRNSLDESTEPYLDRRSPVGTSRMAGPPKNHICPLHRLGYHTLPHERKTQPDHPHNWAPPIRRHTRLLVVHPQH